jgi:hypothetical protein
MGTKQKFGIGIMVATTRTDAAGNILAVPASYRLGILQDVQADFSFDSKQLYGANQLPVDQGRGNAKWTFDAKAADINGAAYAALHFGVTPTVGVKLPVFDYAAPVPATPYQITVAPPGSGTFVSDLGVQSAAGAQYTRVASAPVTGQYSVSGAGVYTFAAADTGIAMLVSYEYSASTGGLVIPLSNQLMGYSPSFSVMLLNSSKGSNFALKLTNCQSDKFTLPLKNDDFSILDFSFMALDDGTGSAGYICQT